MVSGALAGSASQFITSRLFSNKYAHTVRYRNCYIICCCYLKNLFVNQNRVVLLHYSYAIGAWNKNRIFRYCFYVPGTGNVLLTYRCGAQRNTDRAVDGYGFRLFLNIKKPYSHFQKRHSTFLH